MRDLTLIMQTANGNSVDWPEAFIAVGGIAMITIIVAVAIWQLLASWRARMSIAREEAYRRLAEETAQNQQRLIDQQQRIAEDLTTLNNRIAGIEKVLQEVN